MKLGIIGAMRIEIESLLEAMQDVQVQEHAGLSFYRGMLKGCECCVVEAGVGKTNAALCAQALIDIMEPDAIINTGVAGSVDARVGIEDIVVSSDCVHHDLSTAAMGYEDGQIPGISTFAFEADRRLADAAFKAACEQVSVDKVHRGRVASGDQFIADLASKARIHDSFAALCCEMEGASIAQVAWLNHIPFVVVRTISDTADLSSLIDYPLFEEKAAHISSSVIVRMIELVQ